MIQGTLSSRARLLKLKHPRIFYKIGRKIRLTAQELKIVKELSNEK